MIFRALLGLACLAAPASASASGPFGRNLADSELARERGGLALPGGLNISLAVTSDARIDGQLVLRSVYAIQGDQTQLAVYGSDGHGGLVLSNGSAAGPIRVDVNGANTRVTYAATGTEISNLVGAGFGSFVANAADGRAIDVQTTIDMQLSGATAQNLGPVMPRIETLALDSAALLAR